MRRELNKKDRCSPTVFFLRKRKSYAQLWSRQWVSFSIAGVLPKITYLVPQHSSIKPYSRGYLNLWLQDCVLNSCWWNTRQTGDGNRAHKRCEYVSNDEDYLWLYHGEWKSWRGDCIISWPANGRLYKRSTNRVQVETFTSVISSFNLLIMQIFLANFLCIT